MSVIYRKYRPFSFSEVLGQDHVVNIIKKSIKTRKISHAYLFSGPRGTGKTTMARLVAKAVNCEKFENMDDVCNECEACIEINKGSALDIIEMDAASNRGIDEIRFLRDGINFAPSRLGKKVYIIDEAHMLTKDAFNALLKTLEEPPAHVIFILATTEPHKLPITILSRVQRYDFRLVDKKQIKQKLYKIFEREQISVDEDVYDVIFDQSKGSFRDAESLVGKIIGSSQNSHITKSMVFEILGLVSDEEVENFIFNLMNKETEKALKVLQSVNDSGQNVSVFIDQVLGSLQQKLIEGTSSRSEVLKIIKVLVNAKNEMRFINDKLFPIIVGIYELSPEERNNHDLADKNESVVVSKHQKRNNNLNVETNKSKMESRTENLNVFEILQNSDLPMIIKTQLRATRMEIVGDKLILHCQDEIASFFDKDTKHKQILKFLKKYGITQVVVERNDEDDDFEDLSNDDNSDIVESVIL